MADSVCRHYRRVRSTEEGRKTFFSVLAGDLGVDHSEVVSGAHNLLDLHAQVKERFHIDALYTGLCDIQHNSFCIIYVRTLK